MKKTQTAFARQLLAATLAVGSLCLPVHGQNIATRFTPTGASGGGHLLSVTVNPADTSNLWLNCDMSGIYRTTTKGGSWTLMPSSTLSGLEQSEMQFAGSGGSQRLYVIRRFDWGSRLCGPVVSSDGGATWSAVPVPSSPAQQNVYYRLAVDPASTSASSQRMVMENYQELWFTANGGTNWSKIHTHTAGALNSIRLAGAFWDGTSIYVGTNLGMFVSTNNGSNWALNTSYGGLPSGAQMVDFCGGKHSSTGVTTLFSTCVDNTQAAEGWTTTRDLDDGYTFHGLYSLTLTGSPSWTAKNGPSGLAFARVDVSSGNSQKPWAVTTTQNGTPGVFKSTDGGSNWSSVFKVGPAGFSANQNTTTGWQGDGSSLSWWWGMPTFGLDVSDANPDVVAICGTHPYLTEDGGTSWKQIYVNSASENAANTSISMPKAYQPTSLGVTTTWAVNWLSPDRMLVSSTDIGLQVSADGGFTWTTDYTPYDGNGLIWPNWYGMAQQPGTSRLYAAVADGNSNDMYEIARLEDPYFDETYHKGDVLTSNDSGVTWTGLGGSVSGGPGGRFPGPVTGVAVDPAQPSHIYASCAATHSSGLGGIYRSTNQGSTWSKLTSPTRTQGRPLSVVVLGTNKLVATYCARVASGSYTASSGVFYSSDGGSTWSDRSHADMQYFTRDISVAPLQTGETASPRWFAAVESVDSGTSFVHSYDNRGGVYRTTDSGNNWTRIFTKDSVQSVTLVPGSTPLLYVTTSDDGLHVSADPYASTPTFTKVTAFPFSRARRVFVDPYRKDGTVWVTTQGGGVWRGMPALTMISSVLKNGANYDLQVDVMETSSSAPTLKGITALDAAGTAWTTLSGITPSSTSITGGTRYTWASVNSHSFFTGLNDGFVRAARTRVDGFPEVSEAGGWVSMAITQSTTESLGVSWIKTPLYTGLASTSSGTVVLETALPASFTSGKQYYLEIASNGHRVEINEGSSSTTVLALDLSSALNTNGSTLPPIDRDVVRVREHLILDEIFDKSVFHGNNNPGASDRLYLWNSSTSAWVTYWLLQYSTYNRWIRTGDASLTDAGTMVIAPGTGFLINPRFAAMNGTLNTCGLARNHTFRQPLPLGYVFASLGSPTTLSLTTNHLMLADGLTGSTSANGADQVLRWMKDYGGTESYETYYLFNNGTIVAWLKAGDATLTIRDQESLFFKNRAAFVRLQTNALPGHYVPCPWLP